MNNIEMTAQNITIHGDTSTVNAIGKFNSRHTKAVVRKEDGKIYSSIRDAATDVGACYPTIVTHLTHPEKVTHIKGFHYAYLKDMLDNPNEVFVQLRKISTEKEALIVAANKDAEDARKWREYQAKLEAEAKAEAERQEQARIAEEKKQKKINGLRAKIARNERIYESHNAKAERAMANVFKLKAELNALTGEK